MTEARIRLDVPVDVPPERFASMLEEALEEALVLYKLRANLGKAGQAEVEELVREVKRGIARRVRRLLDETSGGH